MYLLKIITAILLLPFLLLSCGNQIVSPDMIEIHGTTMGTTYMVKLVKNGRLNSMSPSNAEKTVTTEIDAVLKRVNSQMSTWIEDSELSKFNRFDKPEWFDVSMDTVIVFAEALRVSRLSGGAFDITVGPIINLWGFGPTKNERHIPTDEQIKEVMAKTGYQKLSVRQAPPAVKKEDPGIYCDLSAIAKGFGVDEVAGYLESKEIYNYVVEIGGEVRARGKRPDGRFWRIGIATPDGSPSYNKVVLLKDISMATSGDYHNYFEENGVRYSHTIDPTTGRPITHNLASVSVIHEFCMTADALATAIDVLGPEKGYELAIKENLPVFLILKGKDGFVEKMTPRFRELLKEGE